MTHDSNDTKLRIGYAADSAFSFYNQIEDVATNGWNIREKYTAMRDIFKRIVNQGVAQNNINFIGLFAKLDYLTKQHNIPSATALLIHDTRRMLNALHSTADDELERSLPHDIKAMALLVNYVCGGEDIPDSLMSLFPQYDRKRTWGKFDINSLRCIVDHWDDEYIYATEEQNDSMLKVGYAMQNKYLTLGGKADWSYMEKILRKGTQLNLVRIRMEEDICMPELIIYEPDYLIDVTTVASCFESYAESPYVGLINKLKPQANTVYIHLGNLAGQFLDDTIHQRNVTFADSIMEFFRNNALGMTSCKDLFFRANADKFYKEAKVQKQNIERLIGTELPHEMKDFDAKAAVLEPTFFSEMLGIQGRLDLLHKKDGKVTIIEQKSGKGAFVPYSAPGYNPNRPEAQEKHLVQLSLYRALFNYEFRLRAEQMRHFMLLYSKYKDGLISIANMPELTLRAIRMRNLLVWCELSYANDGMRILERITPNALNRKQISGRLWEEWTLPELKNLLDPIQEASELERAYYFRFMQFIEKEHMLSKVGNKTKDDSGFAAIWLDSIEDKRAAGNIYENLTIESFGTKDGMVESLCLKFDQEQTTDTSNFRRGDIVIVYSYDKEEAPNACAQMVNRASIRDITNTGLDVVLRNSQTDRRVFDTSANTRWAVEHDMFESSARALYSGMHTFLSANKERRDLILCQRKPCVDMSVHARGCYGDFDNLVERAKQARDMFLVIGPPGTGKTSFGLLNILKEELREEATSILLLSYTNRAVDEICSKLVESDIDFMRIGSELTCDKLYHEHLLANRMSKVDKGAEMRQMIAQTRVICATTSAINANMGLFDIKCFDLAIIDESSQILEPHLMGLLCAKKDGLNGIKRFVLIGDHKQLPAVVQQTEEESSVKEKILNDINLTDCRRSLFERLLTKCKTADGYDPRYVYMLRRQGRMHKDIADFPNIAFYGGLLQVVPLEHQTRVCRMAHSSNGIAQILTTRRIAFVAAPKPSSFETPKTNSVEAEIIAATVMEIYNIKRDDFDVNQTIGIIVPYRNQIATIRNAIDCYGIECLHDITIDTVERYQGSQRDYIIYGFTVQQTYQLNFLTNNVFVEDGMTIDRKLNVAMTRARLHLIMVGNPEILKKDKVFGELLEYVKRKDCFFDIPTEKYCKGDFSAEETD